MFLLILVGGSGLQNPFSKGVKYTCSIALVSDANYIMPTSVVIQSIKENTDPEVRYDIHVFLNQCNQSDKDLLQSMQSDRVFIYINDLTGNNKYAEFTIKGFSVTPTAIYKFDLPNLLCNLDKVLYLDCDLIIQKDISELCQIDLTDRYAAVVMDMPLMMTNTPQNEKLCVKHKAYFNSGVMLLNLAKMRTDNTYVSLVNYRKYGTNYFMDQDALNVIFKEKVIYISFLYNVIFRAVENNPLEDITRFYKMPMVSTRKQVYDDAIILHLASPFKPWLHDTPYLSEKFSSYYYRTPFSKKPLELESTVPAKLIAIKGDGKLPRPPKKRCLFVCATPSDLFHAILVRVLSTEKLTSDLLLLGTSNLTNYVQTLKKTGCFQNIYIAPVDKKIMFDLKCDLKEQTKFFKNPSLLLGKENMPDYTDFYYCGDDSFLRFYYYRQIKKRVGADIHIYESDSGVYTRSYQNIEENEMFNNTSKNVNSFSRNITSYHVHQKELFSICNGKPVISIPRIKDNDSIVRSVLSIVFPEKPFPKARYYFIESDFTERELMTDDVGFLNLITRIVPKDQMVVVPCQGKDNNYDQLGYKTLPDDGYPLEGYLWHYNGRKVFLSIFSSRALLPYYLFESQYIIVLFANMVHTKCYKQSDKGFDLYLRQNVILSKAIGQKLYFPANDHEAEDALRYIELRFFLEDNHDES